MAKKKTKGLEKTSDEKIIEEAKERFKRCVDWESLARSRYKEDIKFANGDSDNGYQWPVDVRKNRDVEKRPVLTINKTRQYCLNVTNDARQNKPSVKVRPVGDTATYEGAQVMEGIVRHIEYQSNAQSAYDRATSFQVQGGIGYWRVTTDYCNSDNFDQDLFIRPVKDPLMIYLDPDILEVDGSDMRFAFVYEDVPKDKFDKEYPDVAGRVNVINGAENDWIDEDHVRVAEYYRMVEKASELLTFTDERGEQQFVKSDKLSKEIYKALTDDPQTKKRPLTDRVVEWYKIAGDEIIERTIWPGSTIPIVRVIGEETVIDGILDRKGHVRNLKDPNRIYNYWTSSGVEYVALQSKVPYIAPAQAIEGQESYWGTANTVNHSVLPYNHKDDDGNPLPPPVRQQPPTMPQAYISGIQIAAEEMRMVSGQYQEDMGEKSQAISGKAIMQRQRAGDNATYHFIDNLANGIRYTGKILIELIPKIYDTKRVLKIMGEDGVESQVVLDPTARAEWLQEQQQDEEKIKIIFNPSFAKYSVEADIGPAYATRRQEAFNAFTQIMSQQPELMHVCGDLMFRAADFPMAEELAERLKRMVPPQVLGKGPDPQTQQLLAQNQQLTQHIQTLLQQYAEERLKSAGQQSGKEIEAYKAQTDAQRKAYEAETQRLKDFMDHYELSQKDMAAMTAQLVLASMKTQAEPATEQ